MNFTPIPGLISNPPISQISIFIPQVTSSSTSIISLASLIFSPKMHCFPYILIILLLIYSQFSPHSIFPSSPSPANLIIVLRWSTTTLILPVPFQLPHHNPLTILLPKAGHCQGKSCIMICKQVHVEGSEFVRSMKFGPWHQLVQIPHHCASFGTRRK